MHAQTIKKIKIVMDYRHQIKKTFHLAVQTCEVMQAVYNKAACQHTITCSPKLLAEYFSIFSSSLDEVTTGEFFF
jgi:hypothetical protein